MINKVLMIICDGLGDRPVNEFDSLTPLESASTPNLDALASQSICGLMHTLGRGLVPGSDVAHLAIFGYSPDRYYGGRGPIEAAGVGLELKHGDIAFRGNFGTVDDDNVITDRRAGRIRVVEPLTEALDGIVIDDITFIVKPGTAHRAALVMRGPNLSAAITDADPHEADVPIRKVVATDDSRDATHTAEVLNKFLAKAHEILSAHPLNRQRVKEGVPPANYLLVRGAGQYIALPSFADRYGLKACCIAGGGLYKGIGAFLGMDIVEVPSANALPDTCIAAKISAAKTALDQYDFVFVHIKAADSLGEDGNCEGKRAFIQRIDDALESVLELPPSTLIVFTGDHSTPCRMKKHSADPVPILFHGEGVRVDSVRTIGERSCAQGDLGIIDGKDVMPEVQNLLGSLHLVGA